MENILQIMRSLKPCPLKWQGAEMLHQSFENFLTFFLVLAFLIYRGKRDSSSCTWHWWGFQNVTENKEDCWRVISEYCLVKEELHILFTQWHLYWWNVFTFLVSDDRQKMWCVKRRYGSQWNTLASCLSRCCKGGPRCIHNLPPLSVARCTYVIAQLGILFVAILSEKRRRIIMTDTTVAVFLWATVEI